MSSTFFSFLLITYKQESFVEEAFRSCINQTYKDFEIIISDDHSPDGTFCLLEKLVREYKAKGGTIPIVLNRNEKNLGIGGNFQKAAELSHGEWLLMAAGDDISLPTRLETIKGVIERHPNIYGINTARYFVDEKGENPQYNFKPDYLLGADSVWNRKVFTEFKPLDNRVMSEDHILNLRAWLLGGMVQVNTPTIKYRVSSQNYSIHKSANIIDAKLSELKKINYHKNLLLFRLDDINDWRKKGHKDDLLTKVEEKIERELKLLEKQKDSYSLFVDVSRGSLGTKIKYLFTSNKVWLHDNVVYRFYNLMKMIHLINDKPKRKAEWDGVETTSDNREIVISIYEFIKPDKNGLF